MIDKLKTTFIKGFIWNYVLISNMYLAKFAVEGHGYLKSPRSRNWVAHEDGSDSWSGGAAGVPQKEYCYHCLNTKAADEICGVGNANNYDEWLDMNGDPIPWNSQATYAEGETITVKSYLNTNHWGHMDLYVCPDGSASTQACFEANPLEYISSTHNAPKDENYPNRGYYSGDIEFEMTYKLPMGVTGDEVMMQWRYVTGNSCMSPGYCCHNADDYFDLYQNVSGWKGGNTALCEYPLDPTGATGTGKPEQFWNCAEITIISSNSNPTSKPISSPITPAPISSTPVPTSAPGTGCCTIDFKNCSPTVVGWCSESKENCEGPCDKWWLESGAVTGCNARYETCTYDSDCCDPGVCTGGYCSEPTDPSPTPNPTHNPTQEPIVDDSLYCTQNYMSSVDALSYMEDITYQVSSNPLTLSVIASGGAAGSGNVVSEGQAYGVLSSAIALASMDVSDSNRNTVMNQFYGYFNGWKQMCINSSPSPCQSPQYCTHSSGNAPCLPGWKHSGDLSSVIGTGAAPDGDEDAILGMIIAVKALEKGNQLPSWYDELRQWTDESITQFLVDNTVLSSSGSHRLLKLGSCWGGWDSNGNNPSYPSPGAFRAMRDFHTSYDGSRNYVMPTFGDNLSLEEKWNMLIDTTYKFYSTTQCTDTGLIPNWALVTEVDDKSLAKYPGTFSGSGTPQYEYGAEASRTMWRVALDALLYPDDSTSAVDFLDPIHQKLEDGFDGSSNWADNTLQTCEYVNVVFSSWRYNGFIFAPVYSTLAVQASSMTASEQQNLVNAACNLVKNIPDSTTYYARSWQVLSMMLLNGDAAKVGYLLRGENVDKPSLSASPTSLVTSDRPPTRPPTKNPTASPLSGNYCCSFDYKNCGDSDWCNDGETSCDNCNGLWIVDKPANCIALWDDCTGSSNACCGPASCQGDSSYSQCTPGTYAPASSPITPPPTTALTSAPSANPIENPSPTQSPTFPLTSAPSIDPVSSTNAPTAEGCYSNNYKDCIPDGYDSSGSSCTRIFLPNGALNNCIPLWGDCSGNPSGCCGPATCFFGDNNFASCVPTNLSTSSTDTPTSSPSEGCSLKNEFCTKHSDCCKKKCNRKKKKCKK